MAKPVEILKLEKKIQLELPKLSKIEPNKIGYYEFEHKVKALCLKSSKLKEINYLGEFPDLYYLDISHSQIRDLSLVENLCNLVELDLTGNQVENISSLKNLTYLEAVDLNANKVVDITPLMSLVKLVYLNFIQNHISDIETLGYLGNLERLDLSFNQVKNLKPLQRLKKLKELRLFGCELIELNCLSKLKGLKILHLGCNKIEEIEFLKNIKNIQEVDFSHNKIKNIPEWITDFKVPEIEWTTRWGKDQISFFENPIENIPIEVIVKGKAAIKSWFAEQKISRQIINPHVKLIFTGNSAVGKTSFIEFLTKHTYNNNQNTTHGVKQCNWHPNENLQVSIWDFGGQEYYHSTHQLFFSNNALYLLLFDKQHNCNGWLQTEINYADKGRVTEELEHFDYFYWLQNIRNLSEKSKILMLQNKVENIKDRVFPNNEIFDENLEYKVEDYQATSVLNAYNYYKENQRFSYEFEELQKLIINKLNEVKRGEIFEYYIKAKELIETAAQTKPVVSIGEFIEISKPSHSEIDKRVIQNETGEELKYRWELMCEYFHEIGVLLYYPDSPSLNKKIFIKPTFVTDSIYKILNYQVKQNCGRFTLSHAIKSLDNNKELAKNIIELMLAPNFKLIFNYPVGSENYIAPQYLNDKKPEENILFHICKSMEIDFVLEFTNFLPKYFQTEFMVNYGRFQKNDIIWKYGIVFEKDGTSAFVECSFDECKIIYQSDHLGEFERLKYEVFETIRRININDKNLKIALDNEHFYSLDTVLSDQRNETFYPFREEYKNYVKHKDMTEQELKGYQEQLDLLIRKKNALEKDLILAYDSEKKFGLQEQIKDLEKQIEDIKHKISNYNKTDDSDSAKTKKKKTIKEYRNEYYNELGLLNEKNKGKIAENFNAKYELDEVNKMLENLDEKSANNDYHEKKKAEDFADNKAKSESKKQADSNLIKKKVLFIDSRATTLENIRCDMEIKAIKEAYDSSGKAQNSYIEPTIESNTNEENVLSLLLTEPYPTIVHFSGHGRINEGLVFGAENQTHIIIGGLIFKGWLTKMRVKPKCIIINACHSLQIIETISKYVEYAIGMNNKILDDNAVLFTKGFYNLFYKTENIEDAFSIGINAIERKKLDSESEIIQHKVPVIYKDGNLLNLLSYE